MVFWILKWPLKIFSCANLTTLSLNFSGTTNCQCSEPFFNTLFDIKCFVLLQSHLRLLDYLVCLLTKSPAFTWLPGLFVDKVTCIYLITWSVCRLFNLLFCFHAFFNDSSVCCNEINSSLPTQRSNWAETFKGFVPADCGLSVVLSLQLDK